MKRALVITFFLSIIMPTYAQSFIKYCKNSLTAISMGYAYQNKIDVWNGSKGNLIFEGDLINLKFIYISNMASASVGENKYGKGELSDKLEYNNYMFGYDINILRRPKSSFFITPLIGLSNTKSFYDDKYYKKIVYKDSQSYTCYGGELSCILYQNLKLSFIKTNHYTGISIGLAVTPDFFD